MIHARYSGIGDRALKSILVVWATALLLAPAFIAQTPPTQRGTVDETGRFTSASPPVLTDVQKLTIQNMIKEIELAQVKLRLGITELNALLKTLEVPNHTINLQTLLYDQVPAEATPTKDKPAVKE